MTEDSHKVVLGSDFFEGRLMVEIERWDWPIYVGLSPDAIPREYRFQGGLNYSHSVEIMGRVRAPAAHRGKTMRIWLSPFGPEMDWGNSDLNAVGQLYHGRGDAFGSDFHASLHLPESGLAPAVTCLSSVWKYLDIWIVGEGADEAPVGAFSFSANIHPNLVQWAGGALDSN
jgi:hypothetical protein